MSPAPGRLERLLPWVAIPVVLAWALWPLLVHSWDHVVDTRALYPDMWRTIEPDIWLQIWILAWGARSLATDPWSLYQANAFHPTENVLARSDHLLGMLPVYAPAYWLTDNPVFAFQATMLASYAIAAAAMVALLRYLRCSPAVAVGMALAWALLWFRVHDGLARAQLLQYQYLPLVVLFFDRFVAAGRRRDLVAASFVLALQSLTAYWHAYFAFFVAATTLAASAPQALAGGAANRRRLGLAVGAVVAVAGGVALISLPYLDMARDGQLVPKSLPASLSWYFGSRSFPHLVAWPAVVAAVFLLLRGDADRRRVAAGLTLVAAGGVLLSLPGGGDDASLADRVLALPRQAAAALVPGFRYLRDEYRFLMLASLGFYALAALGTDAAFRRLREASRPLATALLAALFAVLAAPLASLEIPLVRAPSTDRPPPVYQWLRERGEGGAVLELPMSRNLAGAHLDARAMFFSTYHWLPLLNGYTGHPPRRHYDAVRGLVARLPEPDSISGLQERTGLRWIVIHDEPYRYFGDRGWDRSPRLRAVGEFGGDYLVEVLP